MTSLLVGVGMIVLFFIHERKSLNVLFNIGGAGSCACRQKGGDSLLTTLAKIIQAVRGSRLAEAVGLSTWSFRL